MPNPYTNLTKPMEKLMIKNVLNKLGIFRVTFVASVGFPLIFASNAFAQLAAPAAPAPAGGYDVQLIPFALVDHLEILKDGASAIYGADAVSGVVNYFLVHKFRGLEIGGSYGNTNLGASNEMGEWEAWLKAGTGDDKTDVVVIADFYQRLNGIV